MLLDPKPAKAYLAVFKSATSDQAEPFQDSVIAVLGLSPPKAKADVVVPAPPKAYLALFKAAISVQDVPLKDSALAEFAVISPPKAKEAV